MDNTVGRVNSRITLQGVEVSGPLGKKEVKIEGDKVEASPEDSYMEGILKGISTAAVGPVYPFLTSVFKGIEGYYKASGAALGVGGDEWDAAKAGLKGALLGSLKGFAHGFVDFLAIGTLTSVGGVLGGPVGAALGAAVGGGVYNLVKDAIRRGVSKLVSNSIS